MKVGFVIIGRLKSTRLKEKLLLDLSGKPVIARMVDRIRQCEMIDEIVLATSTNEQDDELERFATEYGISCFRGHEDDVVRRIHDAAAEFDLDYIVNVTADCPLVDPMYIDRTVEAFHQTDADLITSFDLPHGTFCYGIKPEALTKVLEIKDTDETEVWGRYFQDTDCFDVFSLPIDEQHQRSMRLTLDYPEDYEVLSEIFQNLLGDGSNFTLDDIIRFYGDNPDLMTLNQHCGDMYEKRARKQSQISLRSRNEVSRAAIIGCGSIGRRHIKNLIALGVKDIVALRTRKGATKGLPAELAVKEVSTWEDLLGSKPDIAIISNPSSLHLDAFENLIGHVKGIFIEKPISNDLRGVYEALASISKHKPITFVGYNLRFHPLINRVTEIIESDELGPPIALQANVGQWLPDWHADEDHKKLYAANKDLGGGALLSLIHEVQMALDWCGEYEDVTALFPNSSLLELDVDVQADLMIQHASGAVSQIHIDLIQQPTSRSGLVVCERGNIRYDLIENLIEVSNPADPKGRTVYHQPEFDVNTPYLEMMQRFIAYVRQGLYRHPYDFSSGIRSLELAQNAFDSGRNEIGE